MGAGGMIYLDVACKDPDNGLFAHRAEMLQIGDAEFELKHSGPAPRFVETDSGIRLSGKNWRVMGSREWVGNWCWNRYQLGIIEKTTRWYMVDFLTWLRDRRLFGCTTGPSDFYEWFNGDDHLSPTDVHAIVCRLESAAP